MSEQLKLTIGTEVLVNDQHQGVISRTAAHPDHPDEQWWTSFEVTFVGTWRTRKAWYSGHNLKVLR